MKQFLSIYNLVRIFLKKVFCEPQLLLDPNYILRLIKKYSQFDTYGKFLKKSALSTSQINNIKKAVASFPQKPSISAVVLSKAGSNSLATYNSLESQLYQFDEISTVNFSDGYQGLKDAVEKASGQYLIFIKEGDILYPNTLFELVSCLNKKGDQTPNLVFSDHDYYSGKKRFNPFFKPGWSPDLFLVNNYLSRAFIISKIAAMASLDNYSTLSFDQIVYDLCLKVSETGSVIHCPGVLFSFPKSDENVAAQEEESIRCRALARRGENAAVSVNHYSAPTVVRHISQEPLVSIIIPTCFKADYISACLRSITEKTTYKNHEIIVLDNSRKEPGYGQKRLEEFNCKVIPIDLPFNWSQFNNIGVQHANGDVYLFLNDDTEVITPEWLERLASQAIRPEIGVVGPMLLFPNRTVQHAGIFLIDDGGGARHCFFSLPEDYTGYHNLLHYQRNVVGVTGACQAISREKFHEMGGFDETLSVVLNDVDFCLRLWEKGYLNLYIPEVSLTHKEMASRGNNPDVKNISKFRQRWDRLILGGDPYYNKFISTKHIDFRVSID